MPNGSLVSLSAKQLKRAARIREQMDRLAAQLAAVLEVQGSATARQTSGRRAKSKVGRRRKRTMSAAARARIGAATRARWAKRKAAGKRRL